MCQTKKTHARVKHSYGPARKKHINLHMIQYLGEMWAGTENHFVTVYP